MHQNTVEGSKKKCTYSARRLVISKHFVNSHPLRLHLFTSEVVFFVYGLCISLHKFVLLVFIIYTQFSSVDLNKTRI